MSAENPWREEKPILNGKFTLITEDNEFRMSHWVKGFGITETATGRWIMDFQSSFNLDRFEENGNTLNIRFEVYPNGSDRFDVVIDPFSETFTYQDQSISLKEIYATFKGAKNNI